MHTNRPENSSGEVLILLEPKWEEVWNSLITVIEAERGQILLAFRPAAIVAELSDNAISTLREMPGVLVMTEAIAENEATMLPEGLRPAAALWNERVARQEHPQTRSGENLAWDAPGYLPPDPPPAIRDELRRRESEAAESEE